ncbi:DUF2905 domain-containing protein [Halomonas desiderata]|jgi:hypothetical protein|uniref:DUF2905 domain-containing protein n=1 Tax=Billgrantia desiderata TaxID=52021 RepID=A0AAW4YS79_9GAMM|nr:DUF2905 domain-containing protein [Halomonas desiderata]MCE8014093.1 DUF2905 domain-containing protein [Halomonas desiderata]MCE8044867.1 DUF2905 domain-containing protein [Halomonas desiderata]MCE8049441.1 DUF2905 domain-containing protein [Halomonas desiderata]MCE8051458.1 DUF2905 domain-containing protein [Halomonas desiderata]NIC38898.1 DUF2905 domain-containing protein [Halomonas desiderata]
MSRTLIVIGLCIVLIGLLWPWLSKLPLGQLPGDIAIRRENFSFYFPVTTMILLSLLISGLLWLFNR